jgi:AraC-like DNA-binding protein
LETGHTAPNENERRLAGPCGLTTFRVAIQTGGIASPLTLALQEHVKSGDAVRGPGVSIAAFEQAVTLLRLFKRDLEMTLRALAAEAAVEQLQRRMAILIKEAKLRRKLKRHAMPSATLVLPTAGSRVGKIVREMTAYVHKHFHHPMSLDQLAAAMKMNASYLSDLFSRHLGVTFHQYLVEVRMAQARELLLTSPRRVCEVACEVGYASADQFRHAFKAHAGVPPSHWR